MIFDSYPLGTSDSTLKLLLRCYMYKVGIACAGKIQAKY
jgi:hypothetical protein